MDFEKAYKNLVAKVKNAHLYAQTDSTKNVLEDILPELRESEDEMSRKWILELLYDGLQKTDPQFKVQFKAAIAYLEKQKELPFVKDVMLGYPGLYFYDGERMHFRGPAMEGKQKEPKPAEINVKAFLAADRLASAEMTGRLKERSEILENPEKYGLHKPAEWSEEDEKMLADIIFKLAGFMGNEKNIAWLKSLRPSWKPSEEQMEALQRAIDACESEWAYQDDELRSLLNDIKKL